MASVFSKEDSIQYWRYELKEISIIIGDDDPLTLPLTRLLSMSIEDKYAEYAFPLLSVKLGIESDIYYMIVKNKNKCKIHLRIDKYYQEETKLKTKSLSKKFINNNFDLILADSNENVMQGLDNEKSKSNFKSFKNILMNDLSSNIREETFYLNIAETVSGVKKNVNKIITKCNVSDIYAYLFTVAGINNVLMAQPENTDIYNEVLIPPMTVMQALKFIDTYYGLYKSGSLIFFDFDYTYVLPYSNNISVSAKNEILNTNIIIPSARTSEHGNVVGVLSKRSDTNNNYIFADYSQLNIDQASIINNIINSNNIELLDPDTCEKITYESDAVSNGDTNFTRITTNNTENKFLGNMYADRMKNDSCVITMILQNHDISMLTPNKKINVIFEDNEYTKKYNGNYIITEAIHNFTNDGDAMKIGSVITLKKTK